MLSNKLPDIPTPQYTLLMSKYMVDLDFSNPPAATRTFFSISSFWVVILSVNAWKTSPPLSLLLVLLSVVSFLHWSYFKYNSWLSLVDRFLASFVFIYVLVRNTGVIHYTLATLALLSFSCGSASILTKTWDTHLAFHALFRYSAFWMIYGFVQPIGMFQVIIWSTLYIGHYVCMCLWLIDEINAIKRGGYPAPVNKKG